MGRIDGIDWDALTDAEVKYCGDERFEDLSDITVLGEGGDPEVFIIGEAPGGQEEVHRRPFVGPAGIAMRDLMAIAELYSAYTPEGGEPNCWLTNVVKFRPPRNRTPTLPEIKAARPWLRAEWEAVGKPRVIVLVGGTALHAVTGKQQSILIAAGKLHKYRSREGIDLCIWPMVHPSYGIRGGPSVQAILEKDWETFAAWMARARRFGWTDRRKI